MSEEVLDDSSISSHKADITFFGGSTFTGYSQLAAVALMIVGLAMITTFSPAGLILGPILTFGALFGITSSYGTDICTKTKYVREYHQRFFIKTGKWVPTHLFADICILKLGKTARRSDITGTVSNDIDVSKNEVYLMSANHRARFLIKTCKSLKEAEQIATQMSELFNKPIKPFNPQISQATQERKRLRR